MRFAGNINASVTAGWNDVEGAEGFEPIGELFDNPTFDGNFQGNGFTISGLFINRPFDSVGLFAGVGDSGTIDNVVLSGASVTGGDLVGGLAAQNGGVISGFGCSAGSSRASTLPRSAGWSGRTTPL